MSDGIRAETSECVRAMVAAAKEWLKQACVVVHGVCVGSVCVTVCAQLNRTLQALYLHNTQIDAAGAKAVVDALKVCSE